MRAATSVSVYAAGGSSTTQDCAAYPRQIWDPYSGVYNSNEGGGTGRLLILSNNLALYTSRVVPTCRPISNRRMSPAISLTVAQKMLSLFPKPNITTANGIYQNWIGSVESWLQRPIRHQVDHRFNEKNLVSAKYSYNTITAQALTVSRTSPTLVQGGSGWTNASPVCHQRYPYLQSDLLLNVTLGFTPRCVHLDAYNPKCF